MLYQIANGKVAFADHVLLHDINFEIRNTEKIAVVGRNGCGKTTLLRLIFGEVELEKRDSDEDVFIAKARELQIGYLKQIAFEDPNVSLEEEIRKSFAPMERRKHQLEQAARELETNHSTEKVNAYTAMEEKFREDGGYYFEKEYEVLIRKFGFSDEEQKKPLRDFSGGQQTKIAFIKLLLSKPDILLLDEPTNHLDITTIEWLEGYLKNYPRAVVVVSHDRMFLDHVADIVYEIEYGAIKRYPGNYTHFMEQKRLDYEKQRKDYRAQQKEIERLQQLIERFKNKPTKVSMAHSKQKAIEHMVKIEAPDRFDEKTFHAGFQPLKETGKDVLMAQELQVGYDHPLCTLSLDLKRGEKLGILGGNGLGKSTLLKTLVDRIPPLSGEYHYGTNVQIGYFDQQMALYQGSQTVLDDFWNTFPSLTETEARNALGAFLFTGEEVFKNISMLSGGEKVRLALCKIFKRRPNVLILDEPTNHMDIVGKETLESMLIDYKGTLLFVSHDRYFVKKVATRLLVFERNNLREYRFGYDEYQEKLDLEAQSELDNFRNSQLLGGVISQNGIAIPKEPTDPQKKKGSHNPGKERSRLEKKIERVEGELAQKEEKLQQLKQEMLRPEYQSSYTKLTELQAQIDEMEQLITVDMEQWEALSGELEKLVSTLQ